MKIGFQDQLSLNAGQKYCRMLPFLQYFQPSLSYHLSLRSLFCPFMSGRFTQVLLYACIFIELDQRTVADLKPKLNIDSVVCLPQQRCGERALFHIFQYLNNYFTCSAAYIKMHSFILSAVPVGISMTVCNILGTSWQI